MGLRNADAPLVRENGLPLQRGFCCKAGYSVCALSKAHHRSTVPIIPCSSHSQQQFGDERVNRHNAFIRCTEKQIREDLRGTQEQVWGEKYISCLYPAIICIAKKVKLQEGTKHAHIKKGACSLEQGRMTLAREKIP